jgi:hypothetical protein
VPKPPASALKLACALRRRIHDLLPPGWRESRDLYAERAAAFLGAPQYYKDFRRVNYASQGSNLCMDNVQRVQAALDAYLTKNSSKGT